MTLSPELKLAALNAPSDFQRTFKASVANAPTFNSPEQNALQFQRAQERLFAESIGATGGQLTGRAGSSVYLQPEQAAQLIQLRGGADVGEVLRGTPSPSPVMDAPAGMLGSGRNVAVLVGAFGALAILLLVLGRRR